MSVFVTCTHCCCIEFSLSYLPPHGLMSVFVPLPDYYCSEFNFIGCHVLAVSYLSYFLLHMKMAEELIHSTKPSRNATLDSKVISFVFYLFFEVLCLISSHIWKTKVLREISIPIDNPIGFIINLHSYWKNIDQYIWKVGNGFREQSTPLWRDKQNTLAAVQFLLIIIFLQFSQPIAHVHLGQGKFTIS